MTTTTTDIATIEPIARRTDAAPVAAAAYEQLLDLLRSLDASDWLRETECPGWSVADVVGHLIGAAKANASLRENLRQQSRGMRRRGAHADNPLDAVNALQVDDHRDLSPGDRVGVLTELAPRAVAGRMRLPRLLRPLSVPIAQSGSSVGMPPRLQLGHLVDVVYTRDVWMHTVDVARATDRALDLTQPVNARIVADVVREWQGSHGQPVDLTLTGASGGHFVAGNGSEHLELDAVEFCRALSGRVQGDGLLRHLVIF